SAAIQDYSPGAPSTSSATLALGASAATLDLVSEQAEQVTSPLLALRSENDKAPATHLQPFFNALANFTGISWNGCYTGVLQAGIENKKLVGYRSIPSSALSFLLDRIPEKTKPEIKELLKRVNRESDCVHRAFLLVKAIRAFSDTVVLWPGAAVSFGLLLGLNSYTVLSWTRSLPDIPTAVPITEHNNTALQPLSVRLPIDVLSWPEIMRFLQEKLSLQCNRSSAAEPSTKAEQNAAAEPNVTTPSVMNFTFETNFIAQQEQGIAEQMQTFNSENDEDMRDIFFARIICALKDDYQLPFGTFFHVCKWLNVSRGNVSSWYSKYQKRITQDHQPTAAMPIFPAQPMTNLVLQPMAMPATSFVITPAGTTNRPERTPPPQVAGAQIPHTNEMTTSAPSLVSAAIARQEQSVPLQQAPLVHERDAAATKPVLAVPTTASSSVTTNLNPTFPPFMQGTPEDETEENQDAQPSSSSALGFGWLSNEDFGDVSDITKDDLLALLTDGSPSRILEGIEEDLMIDGENEEQD
ncbi:MAG: hypothetical protein ACRDAP_19685, partial [Shewanella sp.]